jgi:hypothetical protein
MLAGLCPLIPARANCPAVWSDAFVGWEFDGEVLAWALFDSGEGPELYAGGNFTKVNQQRAEGIARWDGRRWHPLPNSINGEVRALAVFDDDGDGPLPPRLYIGGSFSPPGSTIVNRGLIRWTGESWLYGGAFAASPASVYAMVEYEVSLGSLGTERRLAIGGEFVLDILPGSPNIVEWNGATLRPIGSGLPGRVHALAPRSAGGPESHPTLFAAGVFPGGANFVVERTAATWIHRGGVGLDGAVRALAVLDRDGNAATPDDVIAGGEFSTIGSIAANGIAAWNGSAWSPLGEGVLLADGARGAVHALRTVHDGEAGAASLLVGGEFASAGGVATQHIARWNADGWAAEDRVPGIVRSIAAFPPTPDSPEDQPRFVGITPSPRGAAFAWRSGHWLPGGNGLDGDVHAIIEWDDDGAGPNPPAVYVGGSFSAAGRVRAFNIARLRDSTWSAVGGGASSLSESSIVRALTVYDPDGPGAAPSALFAAGALDDHPAARWDGQAWTYFPIADGEVGVALAEWDSDGVGPNPPALYLATESGRLHRYDGSTWSLVFEATGLNHAMVVHDPDGSGPEESLPCVGGQFTAFPGASQIVGVYCWDGVAATPLDGGSGITPKRVSHLISWDNDGTGPNPPRLIAGGEFATVTNTLCKWDGNAWTPHSSTNVAIEALGLWSLDRPDVPPHLVIGYAYWGPFLGTVGVHWVSGGVTVNPPTGPTNGPTTAIGTQDPDGDGPRPTQLLLGGRFALLGGDSFQQFSHHFARLGRVAQTGGGACVNERDNSSTCADVAQQADCRVFVCSVADLLPGGLAGCHGDTTGDGLVDGEDRRAIADHIGRVEAEAVCVHDVDGNGVINAGDRGLVSANLGQCRPLPDYQNGSGLNRGLPDTRFGSAVWLGECTSCETEGFGP